MKVDVHDLNRLEREIAGHVNALASAARRALIAGTDAGQAETVAQLLLRVRAILAEGEPQREVNGPWQGRSPAS